MQAQSQAARNPMPGGHLKLLHQEHCDQELATMLATMTTIAMVRSVVRWQHLRTDFHLTVLCR
jgi:hypothetical protein